MNVGTMIYSNGDVYSGEWKRGKKHGKVYKDINYNHTMRSIFFSESLLFHLNHTNSCSNHNKKKKKKKKK